MDAQGGNGCAIMRRSDGVLLANAYLYVGRLQDAIDVAESVLRFEHRPNLVTSAARDVIGEARERSAR